MISSLLFCSCYVHQLMWTADTKKKCLNIESIFIFFSFIFKRSYKWSYAYAQKSGNGILTDVTICSMILPKVATSKCSSLHFLPPYIRRSSLTALNIFFGKVDYVSSYIVSLNKQKVPLYSFFSNAYGGFFYF